MSEKCSILADVCPKCNHVHRWNIGLLDPEFGSYQVCSCGIEEHPNDWRICMCRVSRNDLDYYGIEK